MIDGFIALELKIYCYDSRKIQSWRRKNKSKIIGKGHYEDGYYYVCMVKLNKGETIEFPDTALNLVEQKLVDILLTEVKR
jgi:hypothetical protein